MRLKRKLFFIGIGNLRTGSSQFFNGIRRGGPLLTDAQRHTLRVNGLKNMTKGAVKFGVGATAIAGGTALLAGSAIKKAATDG